MHSVTHMRPWLRALIPLLVLAVVLAASRPAHAGGIVYVVPGGAGGKTGANWANAKDLAPALAAANSGDELWVKAGTYKPNTSGLTYPRAAAFTLKSGVAVYGGFAGSEGRRDQRNPTANVTTLSGDLNGDDGPNFANYGDNSFHVVNGSGTDNTAILDGVTVSGGNADGSGGGNANGGGGMYNYGGSPTVANVIFSGNFASTDGGGMVNINGSNPTLTNVTFSYNETPNAGAGMYNYDSNPTLTNVTFSGNFASTNGGGMANNGSNPTLTNVTFSGNTATVYGGGMSNNGGSPTLTNVTFSGNSASTNGGGMANNGSNPTLTNVTFNGNSASTNGGGMYNNSSSPTLTNVTFSGNFASTGGGMFNVSSSTPTLTGVTFSGNSASTGGGMANDGSSATIRNSILWGDTATNGGEIYNINGGSAAVSYSIVQQASGVYPGTGNLNADPKFVTVVPSPAPSTGGNLRLQSSSPAINVGAPAITGLPATDRDGNPRIVGAMVDMGAYEALCPSDTPATLYVNAAVSGGLDDGSSWANASPTLAFALARANVCATVTQVWVAKGTYKPDPTGLTDPRRATFQLKSGVAIYGGFAGTETTRDARNWQTNVTTLSGDLNGDDGANFANTDENAYHVVTVFKGVDATAILDGFTIRAGVALGLTGICLQPTVPGPCGGGIWEEEASATFNNLIITDNLGGFMGGGVVVGESDSTFTNVTISNNSARNLPSSIGGGMVIEEGGPTLTNVTFAGNVSVTNGGGLAIFRASPTLTNVTFRSNQAPLGAGVYVTSQGWPTLTNVAFINNMATFGGGGLAVDDSSSTTVINAVFIGNYGRYGGGVWSQVSQVNITNATFNGNLAEQGGAVYSDNYGDTILTNSIIWGDGAVRPEVPLVEIYNVGSGQNSVNYSIVQGGYPGTGNLASDPQLLSPVPPDTAPRPNANMRLGPTSPAINAGDPNATIPPLAATDMDGNPRIIGGHVDMGAYESQVLDAPPDTSLATTPTSTSAPSVSFTFAGSDDTTPAANLTFQCSLDNAPFTACVSPQAYTGLSDGSHTFQVRAVDAGGNVDPTPASFTWSVDATPPTATIAIKPSSSSNSTSASFTFSGQDNVTPAANLTFQCSLDNAPFTACASAKTYSGLSVGSHTLQVRAVDGVGNVGTPASFTWVVDTAPPHTSLPPAPLPPSTSGPSVSFVFAGADDATPSSSLTFQCSLDNAPFTACTSPQAYSGLSDGSHTFQVRAVDAAGNVDPAPASFTWTVDATPPTVTRNTALDSCSVPGVNGWCRGTQTAGFTASDAGSGVVSPCSGASCSFTQTSAANGNSVSIASGQVCDAVGNCAPGLTAGPFKIDSVAPTASITTPPNGATYTLGTAVSASYTCADTGGSGVATCSGTVASGSAIDTATPGAKTFTVSVTDNAGNAGSGQVSYTVVYNWSGFFSPVSAPPTVNTARAGSAIPLKFSLGGNQGLSIFAAGSPSSQQVNCDSGAPINTVEQTVTAGASGLQYDGSSGQYTYVWKTQSAWSGQCRQLSVKLVDGSTHVANFKFR